MTYPLITVIIPIYKVEKYLSKCIDSLIDQDYTQLEIILVDDGSPDNCGNICDKYAIQDNRIKVIHKKNGGLSDARNAGLKISTGDFITFVDSDDYVNKDFISTLVNLIQDFEADIAISPFIHFTDDEKKVKKILSINKVKTYTNIEGLINMFYQSDFDNNATSKLFKKELFFNVTFPKGLLYEDLATVYKLFLNSNKIVFINKFNYNYLLRDESIEGSLFSQEKLDSLLKIIVELEALKKSNHEILEAVNCRILSFLFHLLFETEKASKAERQIFSLIKKYRISVLIDINARKKARYSALLSFLGIKCLRFFYKFVKSRK